MPEHRAPIRRALEIVQPLEVLLEPLAHDPIVHRFPRTAGEAAGDAGDLTLAALGYLNGYVEPALRKAAVEMDELGLEYDDGDAGLLIKGQYLLFTIHAAVASFSSGLDAATREDIVLWGAHRLIREYCDRLHGALEPEEEAAA